MRAELHHLVSKLKLVGGPLNIPEKHHSSRSLEPFLKVFRFPSVPLTGCDVFQISAAPVLEALPVRFLYVVS